LFKLKAFSALLVACALGAFHVLFFVEHRVPYVMINVIFLFAAAAGYIFPDIISYLMIALSWLVFYPVFTHLYRIDPLNAIMPLVVYNGLLLVAVAYKNIIKREGTLWLRRLDEQELVRVHLSEEYGNAERFEESVKAKELAIINLYEITKRMSEGLKFDDIFNTLGVFLKDNFVFRKCDLLVLKHEEDKTGIDREFSVWQARKPIGANSAAVSGGAPDFDKLIKMFMEGLRDIYISRSENPRTLDDLGITHPDVETFVAIPLLSEKKMVGILSIENLPKADVERLVILSMQFALEIKKVLLYEMVERMAITDSLTGLYVRRHFYERMNEEMKRSKRYRLNFAFLMLDIDDFKRCNDTYGHLVGDFILKDIARVIKENVREIDVVARYGGEEISLVLPETGGESARVAAERLRRKIEEQVFKAYDEKLKLTVSIGVSIYPKDSTDARSLIDRADEALYAAKKSGKNVVCEYKR
jgi:diguanylate cyclase (GGDEF)-like protein